MANTTKFRYSGLIKVNGGIDEYHDPIEIDGNRKQSGEDFHIDGSRLRKRPGRKLFGDEFSDAFNGGAEYIKADGTTELIVMAGAELFRVADDGSLTSIGTITNERVHMHTHRGFLWINSTNNQKRWDGTSLDPVGAPAAPSAGPAVVSAGAGNLTGSYAWRVTNVIEDGDQVRLLESNPSPISASLVLASENATVTLAVSSDTRCNARYIYRSFAGGEKYYLDGIVHDNTTTSYESGSVADASLGSEVETNHGIPVTAPISEGANERMFWLKDGKLYYSESDRSDAYMEYQKSLSFYTLPKKGEDRGMRALYNINTGKDDLYIFQESAVSVLPGADPLARLYTPVDYVGCAQHDTIVDYNNALVFLTNRKSVGWISGGKYLDISKRSIPTSLDKIFDTNKASAALIYQHYYALCIRDDRGRLFNNKIWVCDLRKIREVSEGQADAVWYPWNVDAEFVISRNNGEVITLPNTI